MIKKFGLGLLVAGLIGAGYSYAEPKLAKPDLTKATKVSELDLKKLELDSIKINKVNDDAKAVRDPLLAEYTAIFKTYGLTVNVDQVNADGTITRAPKPEVKPVTPPVKK